MSLLREIYIIKQKHKYRSSGQQPNVIHPFASLCATPFSQDLACSNIGRGSISDFLRKKPNDATRAARRHGTRKACNSRRSTAVGIGPLQWRILSMRAMDASPAWCGEKDQLLSSCLSENIKHHENS